MRELAAADIRQLLQQGPAQFVVEEVGKPLRWIPLADCFSFWKANVQSHVATPGGSVYLSNYQGDYCYFASEWQVKSRSPLVLLTSTH